MIYSRSAEYAIRGLVELALQPAGKHQLAKRIASDASVPSYFLAKLLQDLVREGLLESNKGPGGGFRLALPADRITLRRVAEAVDGAGRLERCPAGSAECNDRAVCPMHESWKTLRGEILAYLDQTTLADLARSLESKRMQEKRRADKRSASEPVTAGPAKPKGGKRARR